MLKKLLRSFFNPSAKLRATLRIFEATLTQLEDVSKDCDKRIDEINLESARLHDERSVLNDTNFRAQNIAAKMREFLS